MELLNIIILAIVQGITEFLPVSSSGHLLLVPFLFDGNDQGAMMDLAVHFGSLFAVILYFNQDVKLLFVGLFDLLKFKKTPNQIFFVQLCLASLPVLFLGAILVATGLHDHLRNAWVIAFANLFFAVVLWRSDKEPQTDKSFSENNFKDKLIIGLSQVLSLIPGTSRSGITISSARFLGYNRIEAAKFSMLLSIPTILAGGAAAFVKTAMDVNAAIIMEDMVIGAGLSFFAALLSIHVMLTLLKRISLFPFVIYRIILGLALIAYLTF